MDEPGHHSGRLEDWVGFESLLVCVSQAGDLGVQKVGERDFESLCEQLD